MKLYQVLIIISLLLALLSLFSEWLVVSVLGEYRVTLYGLYKVIIENLDKLDNIPVSNNEEPQYTIKIGELILSIILYPISLVTSLISLKYRRAILLASIASVATGFLWIIGFETIKTDLIQQSKESDPISQILISIVSSSISYGIGPYIIIAAGIILLLAYAEDKKETTTQKDIPTTSTNKNINQQNI